MKLKLIGFMLVLSIFLAGCNSEKENTSTSNGNTSEVTDQEYLKIYTTLYPLEDFIKKIGGEYVEVESIMPPGADAHTFEPTTKQMTFIAEADAFIYNGLGMEPFAEKMGTALKNEKVRMVEATHGIETMVHDDGHGHEEESAETDEHGHEEEQAETDEHGHEQEQAETDEHGHEEELAETDEHGHEEESAETDEDGHDHGDFDPHVWLDPYRSIILAENIKNTLIELQPAAKEEFEKNYESLKSELETLDEEFHKLV